MNRCIRNAAMRRTFPFLVVGSLALCAAPAHAQSDDQYDLTIRMEMVGMPMAMPPMTQRICVRKNGNASDYVPRQQDCRISDAARSGARLTFAIACSGMTGTGEFMFASDGYNGQIRMRGKMDGQDVDMTQHIAGRRSGACTAP